MSQQADGNIREGRRNTRGHVPHLGLVPELHSLVLFGEVVSVS